VQSIPHRNVSPVQSQRARGSMEFVDKNTIKIISGDLETFELSTEAARLSKVINEQIADGGRDRQIVLRLIDSDSP
jgi:hypothetical protein